MIQPAGCWIDPMRQPWSCVLHVVCWLDCMCTLQAEHGVGLGCHMQPMPQTPFATCSDGSDPTPCAGSGCHLQSKLQGWHVLPIACRSGPTMHIAYSIRAGPWCCMWHRGAGAWGACSTPDCLPVLPATLGPAYGLQAVGTLSQPWHRHMLHAVCRLDMASWLLHSGSGRVGPADWLRDAYSACWARHSMYIA